MLAWAPSIRLLMGRPGSPKYPISKVVADTIASATTNAAAAANTGWQRAEIHSNTGNRVIGSTVAHDALGSKIEIALITVIAASAPAPSVNSFGDGGTRMDAATPISSGATVAIPSESDATQCCQVIRLEALGLWNKR